MDPDELLRELVINARTLIATSEDPLVLKVAEGVLNLHQWIGRGGYLPAAWAPREATVSLLHHDPGRSGL